MQHIASGKVREIYSLDDERLLIVSTDRISAFDVIMNEPVPDRGQVLTGLTAYWLQKVASDLPNHLLSLELPDEAAHLQDAVGRSMIVRKAEMLPVELIVRGYLAGSGWKEYQHEGTLHGKRLPAGLSLGSKLPEPVLTPSTKGELGQHDINLTYEQAADVVGADVLKEAESLALELFTRANARANEVGLILADTKFEMGYIDGTLSLCDEILTPDSSRYWPIDGWELGQSPPAFDKQYLRDYLDNLDWDKKAPPPTLPDEVIANTRRQYVEAFERITGDTFSNWPGASA